jgi:hypothetical protein
MLIRSLDTLLNQGAAADLGIEGGWAPSQCHGPHVILGLFSNSSQHLRLILEPEPQGCMSPAPALALMPIPTL